MGTGRGVFVVAVMIIALVVAGCGGGSDDSSTAEGSVSKAAFIKKVDSVCQKGTERMQQAILIFLQQHKGVQRPNTVQSEKLVSTAIVPSVKTEIKELKALDAPEGDEERVDAIIGALEEGLETAEGNPEAVVASSDAVFGIPGRLASEYGAEACGRR
jgi:hypothetical protein